ncbi:uncharacterized protein LOC101449673 isoform X1 [Ceratitis capitata]|nr:uncharacterized protein LOC101449673 isoform X1 [Ceratitis capitata]XP_023158983.1 uncharacterized protein LOC101449673 isoform X1 [Ceratitis capitata]XP_023158984.1 uncharacterized protein LOC101449673 isoform X1 [Ceratitis capitata]XP_023158985.1 uncharacterized protein LOC101449673 isoform X1 [Ceratitis capitata]XP_023158986.1 uncharacterized protein LOC101449673 isoform X1 [Ceratitis capitata]
MSSDSKNRVPELPRKHPTYALHKSPLSNVTLDNPAVLEQQLKALSHHKLQLEKKGAFLQPQICSEENTTVFSNVMSNSQKVVDITSNVIYSNTLVPSSGNGATTPIKNNTAEHYTEKVLGSPTKLTSYTENKSQRCLTYQLDNKIFPAENDIYSNFIFQYTKQENSPPLLSSTLCVDAIEATSTYCNHQDQEILPPPSPVSSSYSELRRATNVFKRPYTKTNEADINYIADGISSHGYTGGQPYINLICRNEPSSCCPTLQGSSTYEAIYEPIIPRPAGEFSSQANYLNYVPYVNHSQLNKSESGGNLSTIGSNAGECNTPSYPSLDDNISNLSLKSPIHRKEVVVNALPDFLVQSFDSESGVENYGTCFKCNERVLGENSGCTAMEQIYHISCFTCSQCQVNLQGKPFYAFDGKPFCEHDYLQTLEKCSVCMKPILERILRATGKPYHPQCFTCVICGKSLDSIPFTVDATNQNYCIADFHKIFAPRCCVCMEPIMPKSGEEETVRVVALDRSFHFECYKCEDCGLLLSSEAEGRGCYPLDGHVLCKSCNAKRVQTLTSRMAIEL